MVQNDNRRRHTIALLAALQNEMAPTIRQLGLRRHGAVYGGNVGQHRICAAVTGMGAACAVAGANRLIDAVWPDQVILLGFAGGLDPNLSPATVLPITWVVNEKHSVIQLDPIPVPNQMTAQSSNATGKVPAFLSRRRGHFIPDGYTISTASDLKLTSDVPKTVASDCSRQNHRSLVTTDRLADTAAAKHQLFTRHHCGSVDMETYHVADLLAHRGIPLTVVRAINDPATMTLPAAVCDWVKPNGTTNAAAAARYLMTHPGQAATLLRLAIGAKRAGQRLAQSVQTMVRAYGK